MDVGNTYWVKNKLESDTGETVGITELVLVVIEGVLWQPVSRNRIAVRVLIHFIFTLFVVLQFSCVQPYAENNDHCGEEAQHKDAGRRKVISY